MQRESESEGKEEEKKERTKERENAMKTALLVLFTFVLNGYISWTEHLVIIAFL